MKKWVFLLSVFLTVFGLTACSKSVEEQIAEQLELGEKYLAELNYEEAIVAFKKIIEIDERNLDAYLGLGQVYDVQAEEADLAGDKEAAAQFYDLALEVYEKILELDPANVLSYERLVVIYRKMGYWQHLESLMNQYKGDTDEANTSDIVKESIDTLWMGKLLAEYTQADNYEAIWDMLLEDEYLNLAKRALERQEPIIMHDGNVGFGIYPVQTEGYGDCMLYYGQYRNDLRHGDGYWAGRNGDDVYTCTGVWENDHPQGHQEVREFSRSLDERVSYRVITGNADHGLWNGGVTWRFEWTDGTVNEYHPSFDMGKWIILRVDEENDETAYIVAIEGEDDIMSTMDPDETEGIEGFIF